MVLDCGIHQRHMRDGVGGDLGSWDVVNALAPLNPLLHPKMPSNPIQRHPGD